MVFFSFQALQIRAIEELHQSKWTLVVHDKIFKLAAMQVGGAHVRACVHLKTRVARWGRGHHDIKTCWISK